jgi:hypothetical protein
MPLCRYQRLANSAALEALFFPYVFQFTLYIAVLLFAILPDDSSHEYAARRSRIFARNRDAAAGIDSFWLTPSLLLPSRTSRQCLLL